MPSDPASMANVLPNNSVDPGAQHGRDSRERSSPVVPIPTGALEPYMLTKERTGRSWSWPTPSTDPTPPVRRWRW